MVVLSRGYGDFTVALLPAFEVVVTA